MKIAGDAPLLIGHRGAPLLAPENTLASFRAALEAGLHGVEIDVQRTRDGVLAVHHDPVTAAGHDIAATDWRDLAAASPQIPRLEQVFELLEDFDDRFLNIELKSRFPWDDGRAGLLATAIANASVPARKRTWISSFDALALVRLRRLNVGTPLALLAFTPLALESARWIPFLNPDGVHVEHRRVDTDAVARWHDAGWFVFAWTVNDRTSVARMVQAGVDGIIGDHPDRLLAR